MAAWTFLVPSTASATTRGARWPDSPTPGTPPCWSGRASGARSPDPAPPSSSTGSSGRATPSASRPSPSRTGHSSTSGDTCTEPLTSCVRHASDSRRWCSSVSPRERSPPTWSDGPRSPPRTPSRSTSTSTGPRGGPATTSWWGSSTTVMEDFGSVIRRVNERFGTSFVPYEPTRENEAAAFELVEEMNRLECRGEVVRPTSADPPPSAPRASRDRQRRCNVRGTQDCCAQAEELYERYAARAVGRRTPSSEAGEITGNGRAPRPSRYRGHLTSTVGGAMSRVLLVGKGTAWGDPDVPQRRSATGELATSTTSRSSTSRTTAPRRAASRTAATSAHPPRRAAVVADGAGPGHRAHQLRAGSRRHRRPGRAAGPGRPAARGAVVVHAHGGNIETWLTSRARAADAGGDVARQPCVAVWTAGERTLAGRLGEDRVSLIDNGVDTDPFHPGRRRPRTPRASSTSGCSPLARACST